MGIISPNYATTDNLPDEFKNTEDYQILEFENSRKEVMGNIKEFTVKEISYEFKEYIKKIITDEDKDVGFIICGYSNKDESEDIPEVYEIQYTNGELQDPKLINEGQQIFINWYGEGQYISRLVLGFDPLLDNIINEYDISEENIMENIKNKLSLPLGVPSMPIQDAIEFVETLVYVTIQMSKFVPGAQTVGGKIDIAVITKHEEFKWIKRKHYYNKELNPNDNR